MLFRSNENRKTKNPQTTIDSIISAVSKVSTEEECRIYGVGSMIAFMEEEVLDLRIEEHKELVRTSPVAQWLRSRLPMQGTWVQALVREDPTCHGATKPVCHNY